MTAERWHAACAHLTLCGMLVNSVAPHNTLKRMLTDSIMLGQSENFRQAKPRQLASQHTMSKTAACHCEVLRRCEQMELAWLLGTGAHLASLGKALQPGDLKEGDDWEHDGGQGIDWQPVLLHDNAKCQKLLGVTPTIGICPVMMT